jgi:hypothetical protein
MGRFDDYELMKKFAITEVESDDPNCIARAAIYAQLAHCEMMKATELTDLEVKMVH